MTKQMFQIWRLKITYLYIKLSVKNSFKVLCILNCFFSNIEHFERIQTKQDILIEGRLPAI